MAGGRVDGDWDPAHGQGRGARRVGGPAGPAGQGAQLGAEAARREVEQLTRRPGRRPSSWRCWGKSRLDLSGPLPARVPAGTKEQILELIDAAVAAGAPHRWATSLLGVSEDRAHRWRRRLAESATLEDRSPGGVALHALRPAEIAAILELVEEWGPTDRGSRKLAHRGSYLGRVWVSPSTVRRVLAAHGLVLPKPPARDPAPRLAWPDWQPNKIWWGDLTHFGAARRVAFAIVDVVSRRWIDALVSGEETSTQVRVLFDSAPAGPARPPTKPGSRASSGTSKANGPTSKQSPTTPPSPPNSTASAATTTRHASTPPSATSLPTTNTTAAATPSAKPAPTGSPEPTNSASTTIAPTTTTNPTTRHKLVNFPDQPPRFSQTHLRLALAWTAWVSS